MALKERLSNWNERFKQLIGSGGQVCFPIPFHTIFDSNKADPPD
jgi:hypothetical protein